MKKFEALLNSYFEGDTTLAEEKWIAEQLAKPEIPAHLKPYQKLFAYYKQAQQTTLDRKMKLPRAKIINIKWAYAVAASIFAVFLSYTFWFSKAKPATKYSNQQKIVIAQEMLKQIEVQVMEGNFVTQKSIEKYNETNKTFFNY